MNTKPQDHTHQQAFTEEEEEEEKRQEMKAEQFPLTGNKTHSHVTHAVIVEHRSRPAPRLESPCVLSATMPTALLLLLWLVSHVWATDHPDGPTVDCLVVHVKYVSCSWNIKGTPEVNYTFSSWFHGYKESLCSTYLSENNVTTGCNQPYRNTSRFLTFYTRLTHGKDIFTREHQLKTKVKLHPPVNVTVQNGSDSNLWFYWNQTIPGCVESEVCYKINDKKCKSYKVSVGKQNYCINLPSSKSRYELQVRSRVDHSCGGSDFWSDWSEPAVWGSNNSTDTNQGTISMSPLTPLLCVGGVLILVLLAVMLLHHERHRIILIPVPKPSLIPRDIEDWFQSSKGFKESFKANYNERACPVREYCYVSQFDSESSNSSTSSVTTNQTDCSTCITGNEPEVSSEEQEQQQQGSV
ncbi:cytokine receptor common subunit gamma-like [Parambassis ranga]|uniref:Cytokine receptor common subunit gamma-like n=1 Tax=Parambassis ranga TaxID=210632 RepID=A0A6P7JNC7_9TELE|nr:cytokine receptor common subunit gamma-like [Parambassis ranga]